ncbi:hypothetical protein ACFQX6_37225 [Streptosporangium lutulentum]
MSEVTPQLVVDSTMPLNPVVSPDGRWVAYAVTTVGRKERPAGALWVVAADGSSPPRKLTAGTAKDSLPGGRRTRRRSSSCRTGWSGALASCTAYRSTAGRPRP